MPPPTETCSMDLKRDVVLSPLDDQVGGHTSILKYGKSMVCKPLVERELAFYQNLPSELIGSVPKFSGVISFKKSEQNIDCCASSNESFVLLENLTAGYAKPCVLDLKMGTRMYTDHANMQKREEQDRKVRNSTSGSLGVRFCGSHQYCEETDTVHKLDKFVGRNVDQNGFIDLLKTFFSNGSQGRTDIVEDVLENVKNLRLKMLKLDGVRLYSSSLLIVYDGMGGQKDSISERIENRNDATTDNLKDSERIENRNDGATDDRKDGERIDNKNDDSTDDRKYCDRSETVVPLVRVKVIDFANATFTHYPGDTVNHEGPDRGFIFGLDSIIRILKHFMEDENNNVCKNI